MCVFQFAKKLVESPSVTPSPVFSDEVEEGLLSSDPVDAPLEGGEFPRNSRVLALSGPTED